MANKSFQKGLVVASLAGGVEGIFPTGEIEITENGEYDVTNYETATVNVASGSIADGSVSNPFNEQIIANLRAEVTII